MKKIFGKNSDTRDREPWEIGPEGEKSSRLLHGAIIVLLAIALAALIWHVGGILMEQKQTSESTMYTDTAEEPIQNAGICDPSLDPAYQGNAPIGSAGMFNDDAGEYQAPALVTTSSSQSISFSNISLDEVKVIVDFVDVDCHKLAASYETTCYINEDIVVKAPRVLGYTAVGTARCNESDCDAEHWRVVYEPEEITIFGMPAPELEPIPVPDSPTYATDEDGNIFDVSEETTDGFIDTKTLDIG